MPALSNPKHERFAQELAKGRSQAEAYELAGYEPSEPHASRLARNGKVQARLSELQEKVAAKVVMTAADIVRQLQEDRDFAQECKSPSAMVAATMGQAKVLGLVIDRKAVGGDPDAPPVQTASLSPAEFEEIARRIASEV